MTNFREFADAMAAHFGYEPFSSEEARQIDQLSDAMVDVYCGESYWQNEVSQTIAPSRWGYALWQELLTRHRTEVQKLAEYGVTKIHRQALHWRQQPFDRDDGLAAPCEMLIVASDPSHVHPLAPNYDVLMAVPDTNVCDIAITDKCTDRYDDELFVKQGQMLGFWHACTRCLGWLTAMARVEQEPDDDPERKEKHVREVHWGWGNPTRDLTAFMRPDVPPAGRPHLRGV